MAKINHAIRWTHCRSPLLLFCAVATFGGCIIGPSGEPLGAQATKRLAHVTGIGAGCDVATYNCGNEIMASPGAESCASMVPGDACIAENEVGIGPRSVLSYLNPIGPLMTLASVPASAVGYVANGCAPEACMGPPDLPPPSRFNPVPTQPVFAPRPTIGYTIPSRL